MLTDAEYYLAESAEELLDVFDEVPSHLVKAKVETELAAVFTAAGALLLSAGQRLSLANINRLRNYAKMTGIKEPIQVEITISQN